MSHFKTLTTSLTDAPLLVAALSKLFPNAVVKDYGNQFEVLQNNYGPEDSANITVTLEDKWHFGFVKKDDAYAAVVDGWAVPQFSEYKSVNELLNAVKVQYSLESVAQVAKANNFSYVEPTLQKDGSYTMTLISSTY
jgi:hypothetical protein